MSAQGGLPERPSLPERALLQLAQPLDRLRAWLLAQLSPLLRPFIRSRALRVATTATLGLSLAALLSLWLPLWQLALGPLLWGIPHIVGDLRYLVFKRGLASSLGFWLLVIAPLAHFTHQPRVSTGMIAALGAALLGLLHGRRTRPLLRRLSLALTLGVVGYLSAKAWPREAHFALLHGHNLITLGLWWCWRPRGKAMWALPLLLLALSALVLFGWGAEAWRAANPNEGAWSGLTMSYFERSLAGLLPEAWRPQWVALYGFLQSAHYLVWVRLIPEDDREAETPITFQRSVRRLSQDLGSALSSSSSSRSSLGAWALLATLLSMLGLLAWATQDVARARVGYLTWISAHASLEVALISYVFVRGQPLRVEGHTRQARQVSDR